MLAIRQGLISGTGALANNPVFTPLAAAQSVVGALPMARIGGGAVESVKPVIRPDHRALSGSALNRLGKIMRLPGRDIPKQGTAHPTFHQANMNRTTLLSNIAHDKQSMDSTIRALTSDLRNPLRAKEARARLNLVLAQRAGLDMVQKKVEAYQIPANLSHQGYVQVANMLASVDDGRRDLFNRMPHLIDHHGSVEQAFAELASRLVSPISDVSVPVQGTAHPTFHQANMNRTTLLSNIAHDKQSMDSTIRALTSDLRNPLRAKEARARLNLVLAQRAGLDMVQKKVEAYQIPANLSHQGYVQVANMLASVDDGRRDLFNRMPHLIDHHGSVEQAFAELASRLR